VETPQRGQRAFLDANVIRGQLTNDILLSVAYTGAFEPRWSQNVLDEMRRNRPPGLPEAQVDRRIATVNRAFPDAMVTGYEHLAPRMQADEKDKHVLAAAVHGGCKALVTENIKDFHPPGEGQDAMRVERTSQFLNRLLRDNRRDVVAALQTMVERNQREPKSVSALIDRMAAQKDLAGFARELNAAVPPDQQGSNPNLTVDKARSVAMDGVAPAPGAAQAPSSAPQARQTTTGPEQGPDRGPSRET
jgi:PIN domain